MELEDKVRQAEGELDENIYEKAKLENKKSFPFPNITQANANTFHSSFSHFPIITKFHVFSFLCNHFPLTCNGNSPSRHLTHESPSSICVRLLPSFISFFLFGKTFDFLFYLVINVFLQHSPLHFLPHPTYTIQPVPPIPIHIPQRITGSIQTISINTIRFCGVWAQNGKLWGGRG